MVDKQAAAARVRLLNVRELRATPRFELRAVEGDTLVLEGYASTFEPYEMYGGPANGYGWIEQLDKRAFDATLGERPDLHLLINHEGMPLARTKSGTLQLSVDSHGLKVVAQLDRSDPDVQRLEPKMLRGDMNEMSFAFRVRAQTWSAAPGFDDDPESLRTITDVNLHKGDVSVVNFGANPTTTAEILAAAGKKRTGGARGRLSVAQALAIQACDTAPAAPAARAARTTRTTLSVAEAASIAAADTPVEGISIVDRAQAILDAFRYGSAETTDPAPLSFRRTGSRSGIGTEILPSWSEAVDAYTQDARSRRLRAERDELLRQADALQAQLDGRPDPAKYAVFGYGRLSNRVDPR